MNTPTPMGLNDYVWQTQVVALETVAAFFIAAVGFQGVVAVMIVPLSEDGDD